MRWEFKLFAIVVAAVFLISLAYNVNILLNYAFFGVETSELMFGLSYTMPMVTCAYIICKHAKFPLEKFVCRFFFCIALSAFLDEVFFDPHKPSLAEHIAAIILVFILAYYERIFNRIKETRD